MQKFIALTPIEVSQIIAHKTGQESRIDAHAICTNSCIFSAFYF
jgi:hypothetical protein